MTDKRLTARTTPRRKRRFNSLCDCKRFMADLIHRLDNDEIEINKAGKLTYMVNCITGIIKDSDLEKRLETIEKALLKR